MMNSTKSPGDASGSSVSTDEIASPCSAAQARFWYEEQLQPGTSARNVFARWRLEGDVSATYLDEAWRILVERHPSLRTRFINSDGEPMQVVEPVADFHVREVDLTLLSPDAADIEAERIADLEAHTPFDLAAAPLIRVTHVRVRDRISILMMTVHHLVADGWSYGILSREMGAIATALELRRPIELPPLATTYAEFAQRERERFAADDFAAETAALRKLMNGYRRFEVTPDFPRPPVQTANGEIVSILLDRALTNRLEAIARESYCTLFMLSYAALMVVLQRETRADDITLSTQVTGRDDVAVENVVGTFVNTIALRSKVDPDASFLDLLESARDTVSDAFELRGVPFGKLVEIVNPQRDLSRSALFSVNYIFQRSFIENATYGSFRLIDLPSRAVGTMYDLCFFMVERPEGWRLSAEYNTDLFAPDTVQSFLAQIEACFTAVAANPATRIAEIALPARAARPAYVPAGASGSSRTSATAPRELEAEIRSIVAELLGFDTFGNGEDIFALGFHSLLAMRLLARIKAKTGVDLPLRSLLENPSITTIAARVALLAEALRPLAAPEPIVLLNAGGSQEPLFYFHGDLTADGLYMRRLAALIGQDQPIYAVAPHGTLGLPLIETVEGMAADYLERIRALKPHGPYRLGGYCIGGLVAFELARLLEADGERVERVVLVNASALPQRAIPMLDRLVRKIGINHTMDRKVRARLCFNLAWIHAVLVSGPGGALRFISERFAKLSRRREPVWQMAEFPADRREETEKAVAYVNAAAFSYHYHPYGGDVTLIWGDAQDVRGTTPAAEWRAVARNARLLTMAGNRQGPLNANIAESAVALREALLG